MRWAATLSELRAAERPRLLLPGVVHPDRLGSVALLAGSFDPVTFGHLGLARAARDVDLVAFLYSVRTLQKEGEAGPSLLTEEERLDALAAVCDETPGTAVGLTSHGLLADQVAAARERLPGTRLQLLMGSDKAVQLFDPLWYEDRDRELGALFAEAVVLYAEREGDEGKVEEIIELPENVQWRERVTRLQVEPWAALLSSRAVREQIRLGSDVSLMVPPQVLDAVIAAARRSR